MLDYERRHCLDVSLFFSVIVKAQVHTLKPGTVTSNARLRNVVFWGFIILSVKVFLAILYEYQWYFPADFDASSFLGGRQYTFEGVYRAAFYVHVITSPVALLMGTFLIVTGGMFDKGNVRLKRWHRIAGRVQAANVLGFVVPSGFVMAFEAYAGPFTAAGFFVLSIATGVTMLSAIWYAMRKDFAAHRLWATRCFVLLWSPLLLRMIAGITMASCLPRWDPLHGCVRIHLGRPTYRRFVAHRIPASDCPLMVEPTTPFAWVTQRTGWIPGPYGLTKMKTNGSKMERIR